VQNKAIELVFTWYRNKFHEII